MRRANSVAAFAALGLSCGLVFIATRLSFAATTVVQSQICLPFGAPVITSPAQDYQTDDTAVTVSGTADPNAAVEVTDNGNGSGVTTADSSGVYSILVPLTYGSNVLEANVTNACDTVKRSGSVTITRPSPQTLPPNPPSPGSGTAVSPRPTVSSLRPVVGSTPAPNDSTTPTVSYGAPVILKPLSGVVVTTPHVTVVGKAEPGAAVQIVVNGRVAAQAIVASNGQFSAQVPLRSGVNKIWAQITTSEGVISSKTVITTYTPIIGHVGGRLWLLLVIIAVVIFICIIAFALYWLLIGRKREDKEEEGKAS